jgi:hypothetical protein
MRIVMNFGGVSIGDFAFGSLLLDHAELLVVREGFLMESFVMRIFVRLVMQRFVRFVRAFFAVSFVGVFFAVLMGGRGTAQRFAGKQFDNVGRRWRERGRSGWRIRVRMAVIVVLEIFENIADVEESIAIEANIDESGLHAGEDAGDFAFVDAADEGELFFALDVNFD